MAFTFFFRDSQTLDLALDLLVPGVSTAGRLAIWDAGSAHGPEPYTLAILLHQRLSAAAFAEARIYATDLDEGFRRQVEAGDFREDEIRRVPPGVAARYFQPAGPGRVRVIEELRRQVTFEQHDLLSLAPPRRGFHMIVCKNVLLHLTEPQRTAVLAMFRDALVDGGVLALEHTQKLPEPCREWFRPAVGSAQVFQKSPAAGGRGAVEPPKFRGRPSVFRDIVSVRS